ncbi:MAG: hypothetical protein LBH93_00150 [Chitinispirillales bacterium]|nr:hypothetical protein [Chitinispirillales bacterium]
MGKPSQDSGNMFTEICPKNLEGRVVRFIGGRELRICRGGMTLVDSVRTTVTRTSGEINDADLVSEVHFEKGAYERLSPKLEAYNARVLRNESSSDGNQKSGLFGATDALFITIDEGTIIHKAMKIAIEEKGKLELAKLTNPVDRYVKLGDMSYIAKKFSTAGKALDAAGTVGTAVTVLDGVYGVAKELNNKRGDRAWCKARVTVGTLGVSWLVVGACTGGVGIAVGLGLMVGMTLLFNWLENEEMERLETLHHIKLTSRS